MARVVNLRREKYDVYIGRPGPWGNPFHIGRHGTRDQAVEQFEFEFRQRLAANPELRSQLMELKGKRLGCYCAPRRCHGDVLVKLIDEMTALTAQRVKADVRPVERGEDGRSAEDNNP